MSERVPLPAEDVKDFVSACHARKSVVVDMLNDEPKLVRACIDWGEGDWENGLEAAGHMGNRSIVELLLSKGAPRTIFSAAMMGERSLVESFLSAGSASVSIPGVHDISLIYHVALSGDVDLAAIVQSVSDAPGKNDALHAAVKFGHTNMVAWLINNGANDLDRLNFQKKTPLEVATESGFTEIIELLRAQPRLL